MSETHSTNDIRTAIRELSVRADLARKEGRPDDAADALARIRDQAHSKTIGTGEFFFNEGDDAEAFFVLTSGRVKLTQLTPAVIWARWLK